MALYQRSVPYQTADPSTLADESDQEEDALVKDYEEQVHYDNGGLEELDRTMSFGAGGGQFQDMQAQLLAAAQPLEFGATLETKFASYDNYCNLFHYVLNSEGPVDIEVPSVCSCLTPSPFHFLQCSSTLESINNQVNHNSTPGHGTPSTSSSTNSPPSAASAPLSRAPLAPKTLPPCPPTPPPCVTTQIHGAATRSSTSSIRSSNAPKSLPSSSPKGVPVLLHRSYQTMPKNHCTVTWAISLSSASSAFIACWGTIPSR